MIISASYFIPMILHITPQTQASISVAYASPAHNVRGVLGLVMSVLHVTLNASLYIKVKKEA